MGRSLSPGLGLLVLLSVLAGCGGADGPAPLFGGKAVQADQEWPQELLGGDGSMVLLEFTARTDVGRPCWPGSTGSS